MGLLRPLFDETDLVGVVPLSRENVAGDDGTEWPLFRFWETRLLRCDPEIDGPVLVFAAQRETDQRETDVGLLSFKFRFHHRTPERVRNVEFGFRHPSTVAALVDDELAFHHAPEVRGEVDEVDGRDETNRSHEGLL